MKNAVFLLLIGFSMIGYNRTAELKSPNALIMQFFSFIYPLTQFLNYPSENINSD